MNGLYEQQQAEYIEGASFLAVSLPATEKTVVEAPTQLNPAYKKVHLLVFNAEMCSSSRLTRMEARIKGRGAAAAFQWPECCTAFKQALK